MDVATTGSDGIVVPDGTTLRTNAPRTQAPSTKAPVTGAGAVTKDDAAARGSSNTDDSSVDGE